MEDQIELSAENLWSEISARLQEALNDGTYGKWFGGVDRLSLEGDTPYSEMPNAFRFQKSFDPACTCKPKEKSWAEALGPAEQLLGRVAKSDIFVTPEKSAELAKPKVTPAAKQSPAALPPADRRAQSLLAPPRSTRRLACASDSKVPASVHQPLRIS